MSLRVQIQDTAHDEQWERFLLKVLTVLTPDEPEEETLEVGRVFWAQHKRGYPRDTWELHE